jgi:hypothetical protein
MIFLLHIELEFCRAKGPLLSLKVRNDAVHSSDIVLIELITKFFVVVGGCLQVLIHNFGAPKQVNEITASDEKKDAENEKALALALYQRVCIEPWERKTMASLFLGAAQ